MSRDAGQALVHMALLLVVLLLIMGLAIDYGLALTTRRQTQNAADAGSLAGARELCLMDNRGGAATKAASYALQNGAEAPVSVEFRDAAGSVDMANGQVVWVEANAVSPMAFLGLAGIDNITVRASAGAACQKTGSGCGFWPIAYAQSAWESIPCGTHVYIWDDDKISFDCQEWGCEVDGESVLHPGERGWLDFRNEWGEGFRGTCGSGSGASLIKDLIENDCAGRITFPKCIAGEPGVKAAAEKYVDNRTDDYVLIPLFDYIGCNGDDYHIVDVACVIVGEYHKKVTITTWDDDAKEWVDNKNQKAIEVIKACDNCTARCGTSTGVMPSGGGNVVIVGLNE
jgi:hypothetical protein